MMKELLVHQRRRRRLPRRRQLRRKLLRRRRLLRRRKLQRRRSRHKQPQPRLVQQLEAWEIGSACDASSRLLRSRIFCELVMWTCNATSSLRDRLLRLVWTSYVKCELLILSVNLLWSLFCYLWTLLLEQVWTCLLWQSKLVSVTVSTLLLAQCLDAYQLCEPCLYQLSEFFHFAN